MRLKLALLLAGFVTSSVYASDVVSDGEENVIVVFAQSASNLEGMTDQERLEFVMEESIRTANAEESFRAKQEEYVNGARGLIGLVEFEILRRNVENIAGDARDVSAIQSVINKVREVQRFASLTDEQKDDADGFLINLVSRISVLSSEEKLCAQKRSAAR
jgi:hypothetical protein